MNFETYIATDQGPDGSGKRDGAPTAWPDRAGRDPVTPTGT